MILPDLSPEAPAGEEPDPEEAQLAARLGLVEHVDPEEARLAARLGLEPTRRAA